MSQTINGFDLTYRNVMNAVSVGDEITIKAETSGSRGFSDSAHTDTGIVTRVGHYELRFDSKDRDAEVVVTKSGVSVRVTRYLENGGQFGYEADEVVVE